MWRRAAPQSSTPPSTALLLVCAAPVCYRAGATACGRGGIGRRTSLRGWRRKAWRFESSRPHHRRRFGRGGRLRFLQWQAEVGARIALLRRSARGEGRPLTPEATRRNAGRGADSAKPRKGPSGRRLRAFCSARASQDRAAQLAAGDAVERRKREAAPPVGSVNPMAETLARILHMQANDAATWQQVATVELLIALSLKRQPASTMRTHLLAPHFAGASVIFSFVIIPCPVGSGCSMGSIPSET